MVCLLSLELDIRRVINIDTKKNSFFFIFVRFCDGFCVKYSENKSEIIFVMYVLQYLLQCCIIDFYHIYVME